MSTKRASTVELSGDLYSELGSLAKSNGLGIKGTANRVLDWFVKQPEATQAMILMSVPESMSADFARMLLKRMAGEEGRVAGTSRTAASARRGKSKIAKKKKGSEGRG